MVASALGALGPGACLARSSWLATSRSRAGRARARLGLLEPSAATALRWGLAPVGGGVTAAGLLLLQGGGAAMPIRE